MSDQQPLDQPSPTPKPKSNNRRTLLILGAILTVFACAVCGIIFVLIPSPDDNSRPTNEATAEVAEQVSATEELLEETADTPLPDPTEPPEEIEPAPTTEPVPTQPPAAPPTDQSLYISAANMSLSDIPQGEPDVTAALAGLPSDFGVVPVVIRNNTDTPIYNIDFSATARGADGTILGTGSGDDIVPSYVPPRGLAIGRLLFGDTPLDDATIEYVFTYEDDPGFIFARRDLEILEHNLIGGNVVGLSLNNNAAALDSTKFVVMCFGDDLIPTTVHFDFTDQDRVESGAQLPFSVDLLGDEAQCPRYLIAGSGRETD